MRNTPSSSARNVSSTTPSRTTASGKSVVNFGFATGLDPTFFSESPTHRLMVFYHGELFGPFHHTESISLLQTLYNNLDWAVAVPQELERIDRIVTDALQCRVRSKTSCIEVIRAVLYDQDSVRGPSYRTGQRKTRTTSCTQFFRVQTRSTKCSLQAGIRGNEGIPATRRPSPNFNQHNDPPQ